MRVLPICCGECGSRGRRHRSSSSDRSPSSPSPPSSPWLVFNLPSSSMAQQSIRAAGWRFQPKHKPSLLINYSGKTPSESLEPETIAKLTEQVQNLEAEDISSFLKVVPGIWHLVKSLPHSIPLLEVIFAKCEEIKNHNETCEFPTRSLHCDEMFCRLVWWVAFSEQDPHAPPAARNATVGNKLPTLQEHELAVSKILRVLSRQCPDLIDRAHSDRKQLNTCLESLGCHGLVNCSSGLIRLNDAVQLEVTRHGERVKAASVRVRDLFEKSNSSGKNPSNASHQRQMNLRLSEIFERLKHNEAIESVLEDTITSHHLTSLLRIVRKRVASDRLLIGLFNAFGRSSPEEFSFEQLDPVVAKLIVVFNNAYDKILAMCQHSEVDSGCSADANSDTDCASSPQGSPMDFATLDTNASSLSILQQAKASNHVRRYQSNRLAHHNSLSELCDRQGNIKTAKSLSNINRSSTSGSDAEMRRLGQKEELGSQTSLDENLRLKLHVSETGQQTIIGQINHLKSELASAQTRIDQLAMNQRPLNNNRVPEPDYPDATSFYNCSTSEDIRSLVIRFGSLYTKAKEEIMPTLDELPEFKGSIELQQKTVLSVIVLTYRSVLESVQSRRDQIWEIIEEGDSREENEEAMMLDLALYRHMYRKAKNQHGMANAKEVTSQIWKTLYDFPALKTCTVFNRFVLECVDLSWDIVAGIDGRFPRLRLEWEGEIFDGEQHRRCPSSGKSSTILAFNWPALVDPTTGKCLLKALVST